MFSNPQKETPVQRVHRSFPSRFSVITNCQAIPERDMMYESRLSGSAYWDALSNYDKYKGGKNTSSKAHNNNIQNQTNLQLNNEWVIFWFWNIGQAIFVVRETNIIKNANVDAKTKQKIQYDLVY